MEWVNTETGEILDDWPTSDEILADLIGGECEPADVSEFMFYVNITATEDSP